jgi:ribosomal-protein-alanine N-acetyltransferase
MSGGEPLRIRRAAAADLERIAWLEAASFADPWPAALVRDELFHPAALMLVGGRGTAPPEGYACFRLAPGEAELLRVAVAPAARGWRIGTALVAAGLDEVRRSGAELCHLEVRIENASAHAVYRRLGFAPTGRRPAYYRDGSDALIFTLSLAPPADRGSPALADRASPAPPADRASPDIPTDRPAELLDGGAGGPHRPGWRLDPA